MKRISATIKRDRERLIVYPEQKDIFRAYNLTPYTEVRVVIVGQDPYHNGQADGLAFSSRGDDIPKSLQNIFKEIQSDLEIRVAENPNLERWAKQGVFLINTSLTVRKGQAGSHSGLGWDKFVGRTLKAISLSPVPTVFLLWGNHAQSFREYISEENHLILEAYHPSPLSASRGFFNCKHFSTTNNFLNKHNLKSIDWR